MNKSSPKIISLAEHYGFLCVEGKDALKLLQGQLTCDVTAITDTQTALGAHCNPKGRVISLFRLFWFQNKYFLKMPRVMLPLALTALKKYAVFYKVTLTTVDNLPYHGLIGTLTDITLPANQNSLVIKISDQPQYELIGIDKLTPTDNLTTWQHLQIQQKIPEIYPETSEQFLPHELNLPQLNAVSFKKGCFTGQEIIARMEYRGKLKHTLITAKITSTLPPTRGQDIYQQTTPCGRVVDYCEIGYNTYLLLVLVPLDASKTTLSLEPEQKIILTID